MSWFNLATRTTADANASADINVLMENNRILGGNGTSAPSSDIETLFAGAVSFTSQAGVPSSTPSALGQFNLDTTGNRLYVSTGTSSSADWDKIGVSAYGTQTITAGGGDVTVTLPWDWSDGLLIIILTGTSTEYFDDSGAALLSITTYDSLTTAGYETDNNVAMTNAPVIGTSDKTDNGTGNPNGASSMAFTLDDDGANTLYIKWMVIA